MATEKIVHVHNSVAAADLRTKQYFAVRETSTGTNLAANGEQADGILINEPNTGEASAVAVLGEAKLTAGGTITRGDLIGIDSAGKGVTAAGGDAVLGRALEGASAGAVFAILLGPDAGVRPTSYLTFHRKLADIADGDVVTSFPLATAGKIVSFAAVVTVAATTGAKLTTLNLEIGVTNVTGGSLALTSANMTPKGAVVASTAITAANEFAAGDLLSVEASATTTFGEGEIDIVIGLG